MTKQLAISVKDHVAEPSRWSDNGLSQNLRFSLRPSGEELTPGTLGPPGLGAPGAPEPIGPEVLR